MTYPILQVVYDQYLYIYFACLSAQVFLWYLTWPKGRFMKDQNFKNLIQQFLFPINFQTTRNSFMKSANYFVFVLQCIHRENFHNWIEEAWSAYSDLYFRMSMNTLPYNLGCLWPPTTLCLRMSMTSMPYTPGCLWPYTSHNRLSMNSIL